MEPIRTETILITGAGQGIGASIARALAAKSRILLLNDLNEDSLRKLKEELGLGCKEVMIFAGDLTSQEFMANMLKALENLPSGLDVLVNNAGVSHPIKLLEEITDEEYNLNMAVNFEVPYMLIRDILPGMKARNNGLIINMSSTASIFGYAGLAVYSASKAALCSLSDTVAAETAGKYNIKSIAVLPARTNTAMQVMLRGEEVAHASQPPEFVAEIVRRIINGELQVNSGDDVRIKEGRFVVEEDVSSKQF